MDMDGSRSRLNHIFIPEIVDLVCAEVDVSPDRSKTLSRLARTSHFFHESALDYLWNEITGIHTLIKCMPPGLWEEGAEINKKRSSRLTRAIIPSDWLRFMSYARRVKRFISTDNYNPVYNLENILQMYHALDLLTETSLFPNIKALSWNHSENIFPYVRYFMGPKLSSLSIGLDYNSRIQISFLYTLRGRSPHIRKFSLLRGSSGSHITDAVSDAICGWNNLRALSGPELTRSALVHLANLSSLKTLETSFDRQTPALLSNLHDGLGFPSLEHLSISSCGNLTPATALVEAMSNSPLREFGVDDIHSSTASDWKKLFSMLNNHCNHLSLKTLHVCNEWSFDTGWGHDEKMMTVHSLRPLFAFANLTYIMLMPPGGFDLYDDDIKTLAKAWPQLEDLVLGPIVAAQLRPRLSLCGLVSIAKFCPNINRLSIAIDASSVPTRQEGEGVRNHNLVNLGVRDCPIASAVDVATFLSDIFPEIKEIEEVFRAYTYPETDRLWAEVERLIPVLSSSANRTTPTEVV